MQYRIPAVEVFATSTNGFLQTPQRGALFGYVRCLVVCAHALCEMPRRGVAVVGLACGLFLGAVNAQWEGTDGATANML
jgi:hypothetical protein